MTTWSSCSECDEEFRVITESMKPILYCPFCSSDIEIEEEDDPDYSED
jgi:hypothetical protein